MHKTAAFVTDTCYLSLLYPGEDGYFYRDGVYFYELFHPLGIRQILLCILCASRQKCGILTLRIKFVCIQIFMVPTENLLWLVRCYLLKHQSSAFLNIFIRQNWVSWVLRTLEKLLCINLTVVCKLPFSCDAVRLYTNNICNVQVFKSIMIILIIH